MIDIEDKDFLLNQGYNEVIKENISKNMSKRRNPIVNSLMLFFNEDTKEVKIIYAHVVNGFVRREELYEISLNEAKEMIEEDHDFFQKMKKLDLLNHLNEELTTNETNLKKPKL